ncbi:helix-turn-helix transcriptional regulator [Erythrobacter sp. JK5]|uniref:ArsR/SmtB family transcription factor n=1 Tax=Erythrobacter sp. JK5 TaxID=2829500 RepID=UPI001BAA813F|nr:metalloregulator ArsR/SmtB family transcription factor [Erythrobacter sp. JK5]QUL36618.1 helix-turn-helix transcriptional regulator [Erythrobacter sp. JK5]
MITDSDMDRIFQALSHGTRRTILDHLRDHPGLRVGILAGKFDVSRVAIMAHLRVLEEANMVVSEREGRTRRLYLNAVPIQQISDRWLGAYSGSFASRLTGIKRAAEDAAKREGKQ